MKPIDYLLGLIAPHHCIACYSEGEVCCQKCLADIELKFSSKVCYIRQSNDSRFKEKGICKSCFPKQNLDSINWYADYKDDLSSQLIKALKFENNYAAKIPVSKALGTVYANLKINNVNHKPIMVTAIPTANRRVRHRGWDQAKLIAKSFAKSNKLAYKSLLIRSSSFDQIGASKDQRALASKNFFKPIRLNLIKNSTVILIDDVITTGSTLDSAAKVLKSAGAKEVHAITFARQGLDRRIKNKG